MKPLQQALIAAIKVYRWVSPVKLYLLGSAGCCRFHPSCSEYALEAVRHFGPLRGSWLALRRVGRCHPWGGCGEDPLPARPLEARPLPGSHA